MDRNGQKRTRKHYKDGRSQHMGKVEDMKEFTILEHADSLDLPGGEGVW